LQVVQRLWVLHRRMLQLALLHQCDSWELLYGVAILIFISYTRVTIMSLLDTNYRSMVHLSQRIINLILNAHIYMYASLWIQGSIPPVLLPKSNACVSSYWPVSLAPWARPHILLIMALQYENVFSGNQFVCLLHFLIHIPMAMRHIHPKKNLFMFCCNTNFRALEGRTTRRTYHSPALTVVGRLDTQNQFLLCVHDVNLILAYKR